MPPVTIRKRTNWLVRALPPTVAPVRQIPMAILRAAIFGVVVGPLLGPFFGWFGSFFAARVGGTYSVVFYVLCALPVRYTREYFVHKSSTRAKAAVVVTNLVGIAAASLAMHLLFGGFPLDFQGIQIPIVLIMFTLGWGYVVSERQFADAEKKLANSRAYTRALQSRMNPHFFFNTLNTIAALIPEDQAAAQRMLGLMSDMSRYVFTGAESELASLRDELEFARGYLEIVGRAHVRDEIAADRRGREQGDRLAGRRDVAHHLAAHHERVACRREIDADLAVDVHVLAGGGRVARDLDAALDR